MPTATTGTAAGLPEHVARVLNEFVTDARTTLGDTLRAIVLFGSAAENRLRATSDVNVLVVLNAFDRSRVEAVRAGLQRAHAAIRLEVMWLLEAEIGAAAESFAVKFMDISRRRRVLFGADPFEHLTISRGAAIARLRQVLLNLVLRLRATYAMDGDREERLAIRVADAAGPLRVSAAEILQLERNQTLAPRDALATVVKEWSNPAGDSVVRAISEIRETRHLESSGAGDVLLGMIELACYLHGRATALS
jgi:predicted nucleotidyltransferase